MGELKFTRVNNEECNTTNINIENAIIEMKEKDYCYINKQKKTKFGYHEVHIGLLNDDIIEKLKTWRTEINEYLKNEMGTGPVKIVYGNRLYTNHYKRLIQEKNNKYFIKIGGVWLDENNKPFEQLYYIERIASYL